jgi:hypothetical protein
MNWSWWYLAPVVPLAMLIFIIMASGWRPSRLSIPSLPSLSMPNVNIAWKKLIGTGILVMLGYWWANRVPGDTMFVVIVVGSILATIWWQQISKFIWVSFVIFVLVGMGSCFYQCSSGVAKHHKRYMAEIEQAHKERLARFPVAGKSKATMNKPARCYMNPRQTTWVSSGPVTLRLEKNPEVYYTKNEKRGEGNSAVWQRMPAGNYLVYPAEGEAIEIEWWK